MENCRISARQDWRCSFSKFSLIGYVLVVLSWTAMQLRGGYWDRERSAVSTSAEGMAIINFEINSFLLIFFLFFKSMELFHWWLETWKIAPFSFSSEIKYRWGGWAEIACTAMFVFSPRQSALLKFLQPLKQSPSPLSLFDSGSGLHCEPSLYLAVSGMSSADLCYP